MSVLEPPRIYFKDQVSWDPVTTNNYANNYDEKQCSTALPTLLPTLQDDVQGFRDGAVIQISDGNGNWNPHGTYRSGFFDTEVCGVDRGKGTVTNDTFNASAVNFTGMLVDLEPYGSYSSQLFFDSMLFGVKGGYCIQLPRTSRITAGQINFGRNSPKRTAIAGVASVIWTTSFAKSDGLLINALNSGVLGDISDALKLDDVLGLTVRFNAYRTVYLRQCDTGQRLTGDAGRVQQAARQDHQWRDSAEPCAKPDCGCNRVRAQGRSSARTRRPHFGSGRCQTSGRWCLASFKWCRARDQLSRTASSKLMLHWKRRTLVRLSSKPSTTRALSKWSSGRLRTRNVTGSPTRQRRHCNSTTGFRRI